MYLRDEAGEQGTEHCTQGPCAVNDGRDGGEGLGVASQRFMGAQICGYGGCDERVGPVHQQPRAKQQTLQNTIRTC